MNEEPVGTIIFQRRVAQRRFVDRAMWDRLRLASPVYNGDMIRTIEQSEAVVIFDDQITHLSLSENTIIQIFFDSRVGTHVDFVGGNLEVASEDRGVVITSGNSSITVEGQASIDKSEEGFVFYVSEGTASFDGMEVEAGNILVIDSYGEINTDPVITMTSFGSFASFLGAPGEAVPVVFSWNSFFFTPDTYVVVEISADRGFSAVAETREVGGIYGGGVSSISIPLEHGTHWWRAFPAAAGSREPVNRLFPSGSLEVMPAAAPILFSPSQAAEFVFPAAMAAESRVPFSWSAVEGVSAYLLEISARADMAHPAVSRRIAENNIVQTGLDFGRWYWRVTPIFPPQTRGAVLPSAAGEFSVVRGNVVLAAPALTFPPASGDMARLPASSASRLLWNHDPNAASWFVEMADNPDMRNPAVTQNTGSNFFALVPQLLQPGQVWYWRVTALGGAYPAVSDVGRFEVSGDRPPPAARPAIPAVPHFPPVMFSVDDEFLNTQGNDRILSRMAIFLQENREFRLKVEGHANSTVNPADTLGRQREQYEELKPLSEARAQAVMDRLVELGVDRNRLEFSGVGGERPIAAWEDTAYWWRNRRVEFVLVGNS
ncbi:MAG: OmpA family protein [Treponema sp.]|nr:OmpA family protein [Treponema sp.]